MRKLLACVMGALALAAPVSAQVTGPTYVFVNGTAANADEVNTNFTNIYAAALNRTGGTMTGTLNSLNVLPTVTNASDLGSTSLFYRTSHLRTSMIFGQTTANYTFTWANPASARAISIEDPGGTDIFVWKAATQTLTNKTLTAPTISSPVLSGTVTGTYTLGGTPSLAGTALTGTTLASNIVTSSITTLGTVVTAPNVDLLNAANTHTLAGLHTWTGGTNGNQRLVAVNTTSNTAALSGFRADAGTTVMVLDAFSQGYTTSGSAIAASVKLEGTGIGGVTLLASSASGDARIYSRNALAATFGASQALALTGAADVAGNFSVATNKFTVAASTGNTLIAGTAAITGDVAVATNKFTVTATSGNTLVAGTLTQSGVATFTVQPIMSSLTASQAVFTDGSKGLVSNAITGTGSVVMSASPTLTGTIGAAAMTLSGTLNVTGITTLAGTAVNDVAVPSQALGAGSVTGPTVAIGRNSSGGGSAGLLNLTAKSGTINAVWLDAAGDLRTATALNAPQEDGAPSDTGGTVIGTQTSTLDSKLLIGPFTDTRHALDVVANAPLWRFTYKRGIRGEFVGVMSNTTPEVMMDPSPEHPEGRSFSPVSAFGYTAAAIAELRKQVEAMKNPFKRIFLVDDVR